MLRCTVLLLMAVLMLAPMTLSANNSRAVSKEQAAQLAQQHYPGRVVKIQDEGDSYRIRLLQSDGRVITVVVNRRNGQVRRDDN